MVRSSLTVGLTLALLAVLLGTPSRPIQAAPARPDIVLFYMDDWAPYPVRLWNHESRTPELAQFLSQGLVFQNAIASTPLCGPARANLLTGRFGHNNGVTQNLMGGYSGSELISTRLRGVGYRTAFIGKHINGLARSYPTRTRMKKLSSKWSRFDVIWHNQGRYYDWRQYRKDGTRTYGHRDAHHSSYQAAKRAASFITSTPRDKPLFLVVSLYDGHKPNTPMARFEGHWKCRNFKPWQGPAFNEADVSDKPRYVRERPLLGKKAYDLRDRCEEAMTVDWVVGQVRRALASRGRVANTLQILTADNGKLMGDHRIIGKDYPYSVSVPLYMRWPAVHGRNRRTIAEPVSNVDFARTFCALAGCSPPTSDGRSLVPLIKGWRKHLDRRFIYSEMLHPASTYGQRAIARPAWIQIHSTLRYSKRLWSYTRYHTGEEELYDLTADPFQLSNLAYKAAYKGVRSDMRGFWHKIRDRDRVRWKGKIR